jgi:hypothetical protein
MPSRDELEIEAERLLSEYQRRAHDLREEKRAIEKRLIEIQTELDEYSSNVNRPAFESEINGRKQCPNCWAKTTTQVELINSGRPGTRTADYLKCPRCQLEFTIDV